ncbi:MAG: redox-regulated ATPase YchF [Nanoarchaeota archaeon]
MLISVVAKPSAGKSTFFKAATLAEVEIAPHPFTTIKSQEGVAFVKIPCADKDFNTKCNPKYGYCINNNRFVPIKLMDVPGLIENAHLGEGLGLEFLNDIREADALIHIIDISGSTDERGNQVQALSHDPLKDVKFLEKELDYWYLSILKKAWEKFVKTLKTENLNIKQALAKQLSALKVTEEIVEHAIKKLKLLHHPDQWNEQDLMNLATELRKATKPMIIAANKIDIQGSLLYLEKLKEEFPEYKIIPCSADSEIALREAAKHKLINYIPGENNFTIIDEDKLTLNQLKALHYIKENVLEKYNSTGVQDILNYAVFELLKYISVFPVENQHLTDSSGKNVLPDCFLMPPNSTALDFAFKLHTDIGNTFVKAINVRTKQAIGKEYRLKNLDVIEIKTSK